MPILAGTSSSELSTCNPNRKTGSCAVQAPWMQKSPKLNSKTFLSFPLQLPEKQSHMWECYAAPIPVWKIPSTEGIWKSSHLFLSLCPLGTERSSSMQKKKPEMHEMEMRIEKAVFKNPLRGFGTKTHMNNTSKILQRKPGWLYSCQIPALFFNPAQTRAADLHRLGHMQEREAFPSAAPTLLSTRL